MSIYMTKSEMRGAANWLGNRVGKYGAKRTWNRIANRWHQSKAEALYGEELGILERAGEIQQLEHQPKVDLAGLPFTADFTFLERGMRVFVDVKGAVKQRDRDVFRLWELHGPAPLRVVKRLRNGGFQIVKIINPSASRTEPRKVS